MVVKRKSLNEFFLIQLSFLKQLKLPFLVAGAADQSSSIFHKIKEKVNGRSLNAGQEWSQSVYSGFSSFIDPFGR
jgi:hypothetical protein